MRSIGVAVAGTGFIGPVHVEALQRLGMPVRGVLGSTPEKSRAASEAIGLPRGYASYEEILSDSTVQAVHLAVPNVMHYDFARRALLSGKHVMCEKPLAMNAAEADELVALARRENLHAGVCYNIRFYPLNLEARSRAQEMGRIHSVVGRYVQDWLLYDTDYNWRVLSSEGGSLRAVSDIGTHWMDLVCSITGLQAEAVFADLSIVHPVRKRPVGEVATYASTEGQDLLDVPIETEDCGCVILRMKGGARMALWVSQVTAGRKNYCSYEIAAENGSLSWCSERPNELFMGHRSKPNEVLSRDPALLSGFAAGFSNYPGGHNEGFPDTFKQCFRAFYEDIASGSDPRAARYPTFADGAHEIMLCDAILESHRTERWIHLQT